MVTLVVLSGGLVPAATLAQGTPAARVDLQSIRNYMRVTTDFCTAGQPRMEHFAALGADGVKTVLNLRTPGEHRAEEEQAAVAAAGLRYYNIPVVYTAPKDEDVDEFLRITDKSSESSDVHPLHGRDPSRGLLADPSRCARRVDVERRDRRGTKSGAARRPTPRGVREALHRVTCRAVIVRPPPSSVPASSLEKAATALLLDWRFWRRYPAR
jgi:protein tyrosine phosphatase (PTP) superfamily phosphohydrolase (DUF442 family)